MIETARLVMRPWREADRADFARLMNTPAMMAHMGGVQSASAVDALFDKRMTDQARDGLCYWATEWRETGELLGSCGLRVARNYADTPVYGAVEAGWRVVEAWWRRGVAREAMQAALAWGWSNRDMPFVLTWTIAANHASLAVMRTLGFHRAADLDFVRPETGEACLVHRLDRPARGRA